MQHSTHWWYLNTNIWTAEIVKEVYHSTPWCYQNTSTHRLWGQEKFYYNTHWLSQNTLRHVLSWYWRLRHTLIYYQVYTKCDIHLVRIGAVQMLECPWLKHCYWTRRAVWLVAVSGYRSHRYNSSLTSITVSLYVSHDSPCQDDERNTVVYRGL